MSSSKTLPPAMEYFKKAVAYQLSADRLYEQIDQPIRTLPLRDPRMLPLHDPIYFLYHHATELALKACLMSHNLSVRRGHRIEALFERWRTGRFLGADAEHREMHNLMVFLDADDNGQGYRYAGQRDISPQLGWVQEAIGKIIAAVEPHLETWAKNNGVTGPSAPYSVTKIRLVVGKGVGYVRRPRPSKPRRP
jgi:hypothetical protein